MSDELTLKQRFQLASFDAACSAVFEDTDEEDTAAVMAWVNNSEELPKDLKVTEPYTPFAESPEGLKRILIVSAKSIHDIMMIGASIIVEEGVTQSLSTAELEEQLDEILHEE